MTRRSRQLTIAVVCMLVAAAAAALQIHSYRLRLRAVAWHVLHGNSATVGGYHIPVPSGWFVEQTSASDAHWRDSRTGDSIWFHSSSRKSSNVTLDSWNEIETRYSRPENPIMAKRQLQVGGESFLCIEHDYTLAMPIRQSGQSLTQTVHLPSVDCRSNGTLDAMFFGGMHAAPRHDYQVFYSVLGSVQEP